jgi:nucleoside-diphosphate-sugar epimerase
MIIDASDPDFRQMRIFLSGATGVIGIRAIPLLVRAGHQVTAAVRTLDKAKLVATLSATPVQLDLFDAGAVRSAVRGHDVIINLATSIPPAKRAALPWAWKENTRVRREVSRNLAQAALAEGVTRFIQESFAPLYAGADDHWITEKFPVKPAAYNRAVLDAEAAATGFAATRGHGTVAVVLRFGLFYGPDSEFTQEMARAARKGIAMAMGHPDGYLSPLSHDDAASAVLAALDAPSGIYNVVDDEPLTRRDFYGALAQAVGAPPPRFPPSWLWRLFGSVGETLARSHRISNAKFKSVTSWQPAYPSARQGLVAALVAGPLAV